MPDQDYLERRACELLINKAHPKQLSYIAGLLEYGTAYLQTIPVTAEDGATVIRAILGQRLFSSARATVLLTSLGYAVEAQTIVRSLLECFFRLTAVCADPAHANDLKTQEPLSRQTLLTDLQQYFAMHPDEQTEENNLATIQAALDEVSQEIQVLSAERGAKLKPISARKWAEWGGQSAVFLAAYSSRSLAVHHALRDMGRNIVHDDDGNITDLIFGADNRGAEGTLIDVILILQHSIEALRSSSTVEYDDALNRLMQGGQEVHGLGPNVR